MNEKPKLEQVVDLLKQKGYTDDQIAETIEQIGQSGFNELYTEAMAVFTDEDIAAIADCPEEAIKDEVLKRFEARTGRNAQIVMQEFLDNFSEAFLAQVQNQEQKVG